MATIENHIYGEMSNVTPYAGITGAHSFLSMFKRDSPCLKNDSYPTNRSFGCNYPGARVAVEVDMKIGVTIMMENISEVDM